MRLTGRMVDLNDMRSLKRIEEEYVGHEGELTTNFTRQDSIVQNLQRACVRACVRGVH